MTHQTTNTRCLIEAAKRLGLAYKIFDDSGNLIEIESKGPPATHRGARTGKKLFFANYSTPFNQNSFTRITRDKEFTYKILKDVIKMPKTVGFVDPEYNEGGEMRSMPVSLPEIADQICRQFNFPFVLKPRSLSRGRNFFICRKKEDAGSALRSIFEKNQFYDYLALAQEYIEPKNEYRVVVFKNVPELFYTVKKQVTDSTTTQGIEAFLRPILGYLDIGFAGLDVIEDSVGNKYLLEINAEPGFANFVEKNGEEPIVDLYSKILRSQTSLEV